MQNSTSAFRSLCSLGHCPKRKGRLLPRAGAHSNIGLRETNDDLVFAGDHCRLYIALDGIGGSAGGGEASRIVLEKLRSSVESMCESTAKRPDQGLKQAVATAIAEAHHEMLQLAKKTPAYESMGTVFALAYVFDDTLFYTHVGDARVYHFREGRTRQLTSDETYVQLMVDVGVIKPDDIPEHPMRNLILNAVGAKSSKPPSLVHSKRLLPGDVILLTTDGASDKLTENELTQLLTIDEHPRIIAESIVKAALEAGTNDNASCVVVRIDRAEEVHAEQHDEIHAELTKLHEMLGDVEDVDNGLRKEIIQITDEIRDALRADGQSELGQLQSRLHDQTLAFEVSHPNLTNIVATIVNLLSRIGI